jgi:hypothetical protein
VAADRDKNTRVDSFEKIRTLTRAAAYSYWCRTVGETQERLSTAQSARNFEDHKPEASGWAHLIC